MLEYRTTADGSVTLYNTELQEHYHSVNGAISESLHVYIGEGLVYAAARNKRVNLLEVGFGTGLNAFLTSLEALKLGIKVNYIGIEAFPLSSSLLPNLNYASLVSHPKAEEYFQLIHATRWDQPYFIHDDFILSKLHATIEEVELQPRSFQLVYFDAFAPDKQPEIWSPQIFGKLYECMDEGGALVTYSSKGTVKQALRAAGFTVERLPGAAGKRHMLRAVKTTA